MTEVQLPAGPHLTSAAGVPGGRARNPYWAWLSRLSGESRRNMQEHLDRLAAILMPAGTAPGSCAGELVPWGTRHQDTAMLRAVLVARFDAGMWPAATVNAHLSALRGVVTEAWRLGYIDACQRDLAVGIGNFTLERVPAVCGIHDEEIATMLTVGVGDDAPGPLLFRDTAVIAWLWSAGGRRRAKAAAQLIEDYGREERAVRVYAKGSRQRAGYLHPAASAYVGNWLSLVGEREGPMFRPVDRWGNIVPRHLSPGAIGQIVQRRRLAAGLEPRLETWRLGFVDRVTQRRDGALVAPAL